MDDHSYLQSPRYDSLKSLLSSLIRYFLTHLQATPTTTVQPDKNDDLSLRVFELERYLDNFSRNAEDKKQLLKCGYSDRLWEEVKGFSTF